MKTSYVTRDNFGMYARAGDGPGPALMGADTLLGNAVCNSDGEELGDIKEFMIDMASGRIAYAVLSFGGLLGLGDKLFAVPWAALKLDTENKRFTLDVPKAVLKDAPGFDRQHWPSMSDQTWARGRLLRHALHHALNRALKRAGRRAAARPLTASRSGARSTASSAS